MADSDKQEREALIEKYGEGTKRGIDNMTDPKSIPLYIHIEQYRQFADELDALRTAEATEPVAWQKRHQKSDGSWAGWHDVHEDTAEAIMSWNRTDIEVRPLYTTPPSPVTNERAKVREALLAVVSATRAYLPPDGIDAQECLNRILAATDNPSINPIIEQMERSHAGS